MIGCLIFTIAHDKCPYYRYMQNMAQENMKVYFEKNVQTDDMKFKEVKNITKEETEEYFLVSAAVVYTDPTDTVPTGTAVFGSSVQGNESSVSSGDFVGGDGAGEGDGAANGGTASSDVASSGSVVAKDGDEKEVYITLYFDRWSGQYFASMEDMQQYWVNKRQE